MRKYDNSRRHLLLEHQNAADQALKDASACVDGVSLDLPAFEIFKLQVQQSEMLTKIENENGSVEIFDPSIQTTYVFYTKDQPCKCSPAVADLIQCKHKYKQLGYYDLGCFDIRWKYQSDPCNRRIKRNGVVDDQYDDIKLNDSMQRSISNDSSKGSDQTIISHEQSSRNWSLDYNYFMKIGNELASVVTNQRYEWRQRAAGLLLSVIKCAKTGIQSCTNLIDEFESYANGERAIAGDTLIRDPAIKDTVYVPKKTRPLFYSEIQNKGTRRKASGSSQGTRAKKPNTSIAVIEMPTGQIIAKQKKKNVCSFCNETGCVNRNSCELLRSYNTNGNSIIKKNSEEENTFLDKLKFGFIGPVIYDRNAPEGILNSGMTRTANHFIVHSVHHKANESVNNPTDERNLCLMVTALRGSDGLVYESCDKMMVNCSEFITKFIGMRGDKRVLVDRIGADGSGRGFMIRSTESQLMQGERMNLLERPQLRQGSFVDNALSQNYGPNEQPMHSSSVAAISASRGSFSQPYDAVNTARVMHRNDAYLQDHQLRALSQQQYGPNDQHQFQNSMQLPPFTYPNHQIVYGSQQQMFGILPFQPSAPTSITQSVMQQNGNTHPEVLNNFASRQHALDMNSGNIDHEDYDMNTIQDAQRRV